MPGRLQINVEFKSSEDRLLLRISEKEEKGCVEYRLWLTRRFVIILLRAIDKLIEDDSNSDMRVSPEAMEAMKKFKQEAALAKADFSTSYDSDSADCTLFGDKSLLVTKLKVSRKSKGKYAIGLFAEDNTGINLSVNIDLAHTIKKILLDAANRAEWTHPFTAEQRSKPLAAVQGKLDS